MRARQPIWPGRCGGFFTIYRRYKTGGAKVEISPVGAQLRVHRQIEAAFRALG